ncbi:hypothetical protein M413DRAFT_444871 [Hebeloma cylindrosporum]|uniref:Uncharacterized protein n=1 Tax=Hebeloma cylindrosporum TaxID=76867 RepID=A0A0C3C0M3_HEBCY|nr:hypothetical protein M413DRAFT_444871 [Hebeloma cylindrosporum h7]
MTQRENQAQEPPELLVPFKFAPLKNKSTSPTRMKEYDGSLVSQRSHFPKRSGSGGRALSALTAGGITVVSNHRSKALIVGIKFMNLISQLSAIPDNLCKKNR